MHVYFGKYNLAHALHKYSDLHTQIYMYMYVHKFTTSTEHALLCAYETLHHKLVDMINRLHVLYMYP